MRPSRPAMRVPGGDDADKLDPSHDAISAWLLRAAKSSERNQRGRTWAEALLSTAHPAGMSHPHRFLSIELEHVLTDQETGRVAGFVDAVLRFDGGINLWIEIKTDDKAIGALVRQIKMYRGLIGGTDASNSWLAILPCASKGAVEFLAHAGVSTFTIPPDQIPAECYSLVSRLETADRFTPLPTK